MIATEIRRPRRRSATWWSTAPLPEPQPPLKYRAQPEGRTRAIPQRCDPTTDRAAAWRSRGAASAQPVDVEEVARLVRGVDAREAPHRRRRPEAAHPGAAGEPDETRVAHDAAHGRGGHVVGPADHRREQGAVGGAQPAVADAGLAEVRHQEHRLEHAGARHGAAGVASPGAVLGAHRERHDAGAGRGVGARGSPRPAASRGGWAAWRPPRARGRRARPDNRLCEARHARGLSGYKARLLSSAPAAARPSCVP